MLNKIVAAGLLLSGFAFTASMRSAPATAQSALAQQAGTQQSSKAQSSKSTNSAAKTSKPAASKPAPAAKKAPPKPLVYVQDDRNVKSADAKSTDSAGAQASAGKPGDGSVKKASDTSASKTAPSGKTAATPATQPLSADVTKAFLQNCPSVALTPSKSRAAYDVTFEREQTGKVKSAFGLHKTSRIEVMNKGGKELFSETGHSTGQLVKDACTSMGTPATTKIAKN